VPRKTWSRHFADGAAAELAAAKCGLLTGPAKSQEEHFPTRRAEHGRYQIVTFIHSYTPSPERAFRPAPAGVSLGFPARGFSSFFFFSFFLSQGFPPRRVQGPNTRQARHQRGGEASEPVDTRGLRQALPQLSRAREEVLQSRLAEAPAAHPDLPLELPLCP